MLVAHTPPARVPPAVNAPLSTVICDNPAETAPLTARVPPATAMKALSSITLLALMVPPVPIRAVPPMVDPFGVATVNTPVVKAPITSLNPLKVRFAEFPTPLMT